MDPRILHALRGYLDDNQPATALQLALGEVCEKANKARLESRMEGSTPEEAVIAGCEAGKAVLEVILLAIRPGEKTHG